jgi:hypothetical protein
MDNPFEEVSERGSRGAPAQAAHSHHLIRAQKQSQSAPGLWSRAVLVHHIDARSVERSTDSSTTSRQGQKPRVTE